jgi:hypothetical protein
MYFLYYPPNQPALPANQGWNNVYSGQQIYDTLDYGFDKPFSTSQKFEFWSDSNLTIYRGP